MKTKTLIMVLMLLVCSTHTQKASAASSSLYLINNSATDFSEEGISYSASNKKLSLNNYSGTYSDGSFITIEQIGSITIDVKGTNTISCTKEMQACFESTSIAYTFTGNGTLTINSKARAINSSGITLDGPSLYINVSTDITGNTAYSLTGALLYKSGELRSYNKYRGAYKTDGQISASTSAVNHVIKYGEQLTSLSTTLATALADTHYLYIIPRYTVSFNLNSHGEDIDDIQNVEKGSLITKPDNPLEDGYVFKGWFKEDTLINEFNFTTDTISANTILYAKWEEYKESKKEETQTITYDPRDTNYDGLVDCNEWNGVSSGWTWNEEIKACQFIVVNTACR